jgi:hypothetical protein
MTYTLKKNRVRRRHRSARASSAAVVLSGSVTPATSRADADLVVTAKTRTARSPASKVVMFGSR